MPIDVASKSECTNPGFATDELLQCKVDGGPLGCRAGYRLRLLEQIIVDVDVRAHTDTLHIDGAHLCIDEAASRPAVWGSVPACCGVNDYPTPRSIAFGGW